MGWLYNLSVLFLRLKDIYKQTSLKLQLIR
ncbi:MAG: hypothetical protein ACI9US_001506 [Gammaproteobacteria bacterium]|jgi:hypothetical protein